LVGLTSPDATPEPTSTPEVSPEDLFLPGLGSTTSYTTFSTMSLNAYSIKK